MRHPSKIHPAAALNQRALPLKWHLVLLIAGALLPVALFAVVIVHRLSVQEQEATERRTLLAAKNLAGSIERETSSTTRILQVLAESERLDQPNLEAFYTEVKRVAETQPTWLTIILLTPDGQQLINTRRAFGTPLPAVSEPKSLQRVVKTQQPTVGDLAPDQGEQQLAFPIRVPVLRNGHVHYVLTAMITPTALTNVVEKQTPIDGEWTRTIVDGQGIVVARTRNPERFIGQRGTPSFLKRTQTTTEGVYRDTTLEGEKVYVAFSRTSDLRWTAAVTVPVATVQGPARQAMVLVIGSGLTLLVVSGAGALLLSERISRSITSATTAAEALAKGEQPQVRVSFIQEVALLGQALEFSANLLAQREQERTENLARAEAARAEAEAANRLKDDFLITISHELKTPLNAILGWSALLQAGRLDADKALQAIATIERNAKAQARLVDDLLDTSRIVTGKLRLETQPVDLVPIIASALDSVRHAAEAKMIELEMQRITPVGLVLGDPNRLQQVVWNLLSNAVKFTPAGGHIEVRLRAIEGYAEMVVQDTGMGIQPEFLPHVFDRFRQADSSTTREYGGLGLGLAIVRHLVELHGGSIWADSAGAGSGATFTFRLPLTAPNPAPLAQDGVSPGAEPGPSVVASALQGMRILVVDDEVDAREFIATVLRQQGATVQACDSAASAYAIVTTWQPNAILSDIGMPQEDGYAFMRRVRQWEGDADPPIPAVAVTAFTRAADQARAIAAGYQTHVPKPIDPVELVAIVTQLVAPYSPA